MKYITQHTWINKNGLLLYEWRTIDFTAAASDKASTKVCGYRPVVDQNVLDFLNKNNIVLNV